MTRRPTSGPSTPAAAPMRAGRAQRVVVTMAFTMIGISAIAVVALLVLGASGVDRSAFSSGGLLILQVLPLPGLTIGLLLVIVALVMGVVTRSRANRL